MAPFSRSLAVVIGINQYGNGISLLQTAANDAQAVARLLEQEHQYDKVWLLLDDQASLQALQQLLDQELPHCVQPDHRLLFYFAGHGIALNGEDGPEGFLIPQDAKLGETKSYLPMAALQASLNALPCRHFLGILDCCFAGAFRWSSTRKLVPLDQGIVYKERFERFIQDAAWQTITSAAYDQTALDAFDLKSERTPTDYHSPNIHSPFAAALIEALSGQADTYPPAAPGKPAGDGITTATELYLYLRERLEPATEARHHRQTPGIWPLKKHDKGEYIFLTPGHVLNLPPAPPLDESKNPYRGLQSFEAEHNDLFFGRKTLTTKLGEFVSQQPLTVVLGASGSGKSSLVKAGLVPTLKQNPDLWHVLAPIRPGETPLKTLSNLIRPAESGQPESAAGSLTAYLADWTAQHPEAKLVLIIDQLEELITLCRNESERQQFLSELAQAVATHPNQLRLVLTLRSDFEPQFQDTALKDLWSAARFVVPPMTRAELREAIEEPASKRVMYFQSDDPKNPLVDQLIDEVAEMPGALPLLSFTLSELYLKYLQRQRTAQDQGDSIDRSITEADYRELGGVARSLTQRADQEYQALVQEDPAYEQTVRHVMLRMVAIGGGELARRKVPLSEFDYPLAQNERVKAVIQRFSSARLLIEGTDTDGKPDVEPAHDALVRGWQKLLAWKQAAEEGLILQRRLTPAAEEWKAVAEQEQPQGILSRAEPAIDWLDRGFYRVEQQLGKVSTQVRRFWKRPQSQQTKHEKSKQFLWDDNPYLDVLNQQLQSNSPWFNQIESEFVQQSVLCKRQNTSWLWRITTGVILGLTGLTIAALIGQRNAQIGQAQASRQAAEANLLSSQELDAVVNALRSGHLLSTLLPFGVLQPPQDVAEVQQSLQKAVDQNRERNRLDIRKILEQSPGSILADLSFSDQNRLLATTLSSQAIELWDFAAQQRLRHVEATDLRQGELNLSAFGPDNSQLNAQFSPDGRILALQVDGAVQLWDVETKQVLGELPGGNTEWSQMSFSPNGKLFLAVSQQGDLQRFDLELRQWSTPSVAWPSDLTLANLVWNSSGDQLMLSDFDADGVYVWNLSDDTIKKETVDSENTATLILSPDRKLLTKIYIGNGQGPPRYELWNLETDNSDNNTPTLIRSFLGYHPLGFNSVIGSADGSRTATVDAEGILRLWAFHENPSPVETLLPDSRRRTGQFSDAWDAATQEKLQNIRLAIEKQYSPDEWNSSIAGLIDRSNLTFSSDGTKLAIVDSWKGRFFYFWDLETQQELKQIKTAIHNLTNGRRVSAIEDLSFSEDGKFLAIADASSLRIWDLQKKQWLNPDFQGDGSCNTNVQSVAFSPNGRLVATGSVDDSGLYICVRNLAGYQIARFTAEGIYGLSFSPDSTQVFTTAYDDSAIAQTWKIESFDELMIHACRLAQDYLTSPSSDASAGDRQLCN